MDIHSFASHVLSVQGEVAEQTLDDWVTSWPCPFPAHASPRSFTLVCCAVACTSSDCMCGLGARCTVSWFFALFINLHGLQLLAGYSTVMTVCLPRFAMLQWMCNMCVSCYKARLMLHAPMYCCILIYKTSMCLSYVSWSNTVCTNSLVASLLPPHMRISPAPLNCVQCSADCDILATFQVHVWVFQLGPVPDLEGHCILTVFTGHGMCGVSPC